MDNSTLSQEFLSSDDFLRIIQSLVCDIRQQFFISSQEFDLDYFGQTVIASKLTDQECLRLASNLSQMFGINFNLISADTFSSLAKKAYNLWQKSKKTVTFATSGSTGTPKLCCHAALDLFEEAQSITPLIYKPKRVLVTVPTPLRFYLWSHLTQTPLSADQTNNCTPLYNLRPSPKYRFSCDNAALT